MPECSSSDVILEFCEGPAGVMKLLSRDGLDNDWADSTVSDESLEFVNTGGTSVIVGGGNSDSGSSVRVFTGSSREMVGGRTSKASCPSR